MTKTMDTWADFENVVASEIQAFQFFGADENLLSHYGNPIVGEVDVGQPVRDPRTLWERFVANSRHLIVTQHQLQGENVIIIIIKLLIVGEL